MSRLTSTKGAPTAKQRTKQASRANGGRPRADAVEMALRELQDRYPRGPVFAVGSSGHIVELPDSVPRRENPVLIGRSGFNAVPAGDHEVLIEAYDRVLTEGTAQCVLHPPVYGEVAWYGFDLRERHGVVVVVLGADGDPSPALDESGKREMVQVGPPRFASIRKDATAFIIGVTDATSEILGWSPEEMVGQRSLEFIHPDDQPLAIENWMESIAQPGHARRIRQRLLHKDGSWVWFEVTNHNLLGDPEHGCVVAEMVDISDEMAAQEALRAREQLLDRLAETLPVGLLQIDAEARIVYTNDRLHEIVGVEPAATAIAQLATVVPDDVPVLREAVESVLKVGSHADIEVACRRSDDADLRVCTISLRALRRADGSISGAIACVADVTESTRMREELKFRATFDELTGCHNRASIMAALSADIARHQRRAERAVLFIDLDGFKAINDRHGHAAGDELLRRVACVLRDSVREKDVVGRTGGDEFLVLCPDVGGTARAMKLATRLACALRESIGEVTRNVSCTASIGVAWSNGNATSADDLVRTADKAMYDSKRRRLGQPHLA